MSAPSEDRGESVLISAALSDTGNAERFAWEHGNNIRYCKGRRQWLVWDGRRW